MPTVVQLIPMDKSPNRIYALRRARSWSQEELGNMVGCTKMHISGLERGKRELTLAWMQKLGDAFGVVPADILAEDDNPMRLSMAERELVMRFRMADDDARRNIQRVTEALLPFKGEDHKAA